MATESVTNASEIADSLKEPALRLLGTEATIHMLAEQMSHGEGQAAANPRQISAVLYGTLPQIQTAQNSIASSQQLFGPAIGELR